MSAVGNRFDNLDFGAFRALAGAPSLSRHEKVGFPDSYRQGKEEAMVSVATTSCTPLSA